MGGGGAVEIPLLVLLVAKSCPTFATPWTVALQAPLSIGFPREEYWSGLPFLSPGDLSDPGIEPGLLHCRQIPYHLSHQESPDDVIMPNNELFSKTLRLLCLSLKISV